MARRGSGMSQFMTLQLQHLEACHFFPAPEHHAAFSVRRLRRIPYRQVSLRLHVGQIGIEISLMIVMCVYLLLKFEQK